MLLEDHAHANLQPLHATQHTMQSCKHLRYALLATVARYEPWLRDGHFPSFSPTHYGMPQWREVLSRVFLSTVPVPVSVHRCKS